MLDQAGVNLMVLFTLNRKRKEGQQKSSRVGEASTSKTENKPVIRRIFLRQLAMELLKPWLSIRQSKTKLRPNLRAAIAEVLDEADNEETPTPAAAPAATPVLPGTLCRICFRRDRISRKKIGDCDRCGQGYCKLHQVPRCTKCSNR